MVLVKIVKGGCVMEKFDNWLKCDDMLEGSGRSEKLWLKNPETKQMGLFKFNKTISTTENYSEKIASDLAKLIEIPCADVVIGTYNGRNGCMSLQINKEEEYLIEGINPISRFFPQFDANELIDPSTKKKYSLEMILKCTFGYAIKRQIIEMMVFDYLIGNSDRHQSNWALLGDRKGAKKAGSKRFCPLYDNGSSLCFNKSEEEIEQILGKDKGRFRAAVDTKSKSLIRISANDYSRPTHKEMVQYI